MTTFNPLEELEKTYNVTSIKEVRNKLESAVSVIDLWFPHVSKALVCSWGTKHFREYTDTLVTSTRINREGFPDGIFAELSEIIDAHDETFPQHRPTAKTYL